MVDIIIQSVANILTLII